MPDLLLFLAGFLFNFIVAFAIVRFIYYPKTHNKRYVFTFLAFNTIIYFVLSFMTSIEFGVGVGFGLFAIFSILRVSDRSDPNSGNDIPFCNCSFTSHEFCRCGWRHLVATDIG